MKKRSKREPLTSEQRLIEIIEIQTMIAETPLELELVMRKVAETAQDITRADGAIVELPEKDELVASAVSGLASDLLGLRTMVVGSLAGLCLQKRESLRFSDSEAVARLEGERYRRIGALSMVFVPLFYVGTTIGVLTVLSARPAAFDDEDIRTLGLLSGLIASGMAHAAQYEERKDENRSLFYRATHDSLTGLYNRSSFYDSLRRSIASAQRYGEGFCLAMLDMDGLKSLNDAFSHQAGDGALQYLARKLKESCRTSDVIARLGGDEFGVLFAKVADMKTALALASEMAQKVAGPFEAAGKAHILQTSVGVALYPEDGTGPDELIRAADAAMYEMKRARQQGRSPG